ncbi:MAG: 30S ribosomal protein S7 [Desulfohalobiaceae bacterium]|nr:30S ribosomal protein S7 [Desulfohalobiaceae bacterium]
MSRKGRVAKRDILPDPRYNSKLVAKVTNRIMRDGKKSLAERILYNAMEELGRRTSEDQLKAFEQAVENVKPQKEVKPRRVGGATYQVPVEVDPHRQQILATRWLIRAARSRSEKGMVQRLSAELNDAYNNRGGAIRKKEESHRMAQANKAFAHYRW